MPEHCSAIRKHDAVSFAISVDQPRAAVICQRFESCSLLGHRALDRLHPRGQRLHERFGISVEERGEITSLPFRGNCVRKRLRPCQHKAGSAILQSLRQERPGWAPRLDNHRHKHSGSRMRSRRRRRVRTRESPPVPFRSGAGLQSLQFGSRIKRLDKTARSPTATGKGYRLRMPVFQLGRGSKGPSSAKVTSPPSAGPMSWIGRTPVSR